MSCGRNLPGGLAQLARAPALQAGGQRFESVILHFSENNDKAGSDFEFGIMDFEFGIVRRQE